MFHLIVIGAGSGGVRAARLVAESGKRVALVERAHVGGTCVNVGCVPKKLYVHGSEFATHHHDAAGFGWRGQHQFDWRALQAAKEGEIARLRSAYEKRLTDAGVTLFRGAAKFCAGGDSLTPSVGVYDEDDKLIETLSGEKILIATGSESMLPAIPGIEYAHCSDGIFQLPQLPSRAIVVGGGYIAVEFAGIFNALGVEVTLRHRGERLLKNFDDAIGAHVSECLAARGITLSLGADIRRIEKTPESLRAVFADDSASEAELILMATGRAPLTGALNLGVVNVALGDGGAIRVNSDFQTSNPAIYAIGDCIGTKMLTPVAIAQAKYFAARIFDIDAEHHTAPLDYDDIATAVFSQPNIATVGITEQQAASQGIAVRTYQSVFRPLTNALSPRAERTMMKLVTDAASAQVLGIHMVGEAAGEIIQGLAVAFNIGLSKPQLDATIGIHPTVAEEFVSL